MCDFTFGASRQTQRSPTNSRGTMMSRLWPLKEAGGLQLATRSTLSVAQVKLSCSSNVSADSAFARSRFQTATEGPLRRAGDGAGAGAPPSGARVAAGRTVYVIPAAAASGREGAHLSVRQILSVVKLCCAAYASAKVLKICTG